MNVRPRFPLVDEILDAHSEELGRDAPGYRNHVYRVLCYFRALGDHGEDIPEWVQAAAAFHDLGIWTSHTFDYLEPSARLANGYFIARGLDAIAPNAIALILEHHKLSPYRGPQSRNVEVFRQSDLVDLSFGAVKYTLSPELIRTVKAAFPDAGFHKRLASLAAKQFVENPLRPLPMVHW